MNKVIIIGAGGFGRETAVMIRQMGGWEILGFCDDGLPVGSMAEGLPVLAGVTSVNHAPDVAVALAIADPQTRRNLASKISLPSDGCPTWIHPSANTGSTTNVIGKGCILTAGVILTSGITIGDWVIINLSATIGHDARIGSFTSIMPQCSISGNVTLGEGCYIGAGARLLQGITLGDGCVVGAGAVVTKSFPSGSRLMGVPARNG